MQQNFCASPQHRRNKQVYLFRAFIFFGHTSTTIHITVQYLFDVFLCRERVQALLQTERPRFHVLVQGEATVQQTRHGFAGVVVLLHMQQSTAAHDVKNSPQDSKLHTHNVQKKQIQPGYAKSHVRQIGITLTL